MNKIKTYVYIIYLLKEKNGRGIENKIKKEKIFTKRKEK